ncbi:MAG: ribonuclease Z [Nanoarchaeota archaeon]
MENIKTTFLGTGTAVPTPNRHHTAILCQFLNENILIDCGENTQLQFRKAHISPHKITRILLTHLHGDHTFGLPGLFQTLAMGNNFIKTLFIYGPKGTKAYIQNIQKIINEIKISIKVIEINSGVFVDMPQFKIESVPVNHTCPTLAYAITLKDKIRLNKNKLNKYKIHPSPLIKNLLKGRDITINGKKIKSKLVTYTEKGKKISIILDTAFTNNAVKIAKNADLLISESSFASSELKKARESKHLTASDAATIAKKAKVKQLILTHISQRYENNPQILENEAKKIFKNIKMAKDLEIINI